MVPVLPMVADGATLRGKVAQEFVFEPRRQVIGVEHRGVNLEEKRIELFVCGGHEGFGAEVPNVLVDQSGKDLREGNGDRYSPYG